MVDFSLKKAKNNWKSSNKSGASSPSKQSTQDTSSPQPLSVLPTPIVTNTGNGNNSKNGNIPGSNKNTNPYSGINMSKAYSGLPKVNAHEKNKAASSMHRRLSMYNSKNVPVITDYSIPLPGGIPSLPVNSVSQLSLDSSLNKNMKTLDQGGFDNKVTLDENHFREIIQTKNLRLLLSDENFNAKDFVHNHLSNASAMEIDQFTTVLNELSQNIQVEVKDNINRSYKEILQVNRDLNVATDGLKTLRENMQNLNYVVSDFADMADRRIALEESKNHGDSSLNSSNVGSANLLPPVSSSSGNNSKLNENNSDTKRDMTSVYIMGKMWNNELIELEKEIEGATNFLETKGRHLMVKSEDWYELNATTLRYLQTVRIYIFNDIILITGKNKNNGYALKQTLDLKECSVEQDIRDPNKLIFKSSNNSVTSMYESRSPREVRKILEAIRRAKDDLCDIFQSEMQHEERLRESFRFLQTTQQTPAKDPSLNKSPAKNPRNSLNVGAPVNDSGNSVDGDSVHTYKINNKIINYSDLFTDPHLLQSLTISMRANMRSAGMGSFCNQLLALDSHIEEVDITIARARYANAVSALMEIRKQLFQMHSQLNETESNFFELLMIKIGLRCDSIYRKLVTSLNTNTEISQLLSNMNTMIELDKAEEGLELFLQNRSDLIQDLILQIGSFDNPTNYLTQLSVIRFQIMRQTVLNYKDLFKIDTKTHNLTPKDKELEKSSKELSSILVNWCNVEVDKHFHLINEQLLNNEMISPSSIKSSRKQIDELKSVGLDFVYKLDEFIRANNHRIG